jgi:MYXO-CTERM domain-containing protein
MSSKDDNTDALIEAAAVAAAALAAWLLRRR